jgi:predicted RNA-binding protein associated with RNAse of E/G family
MSHEDLLLATLYTKNGPVSVEQEIIKDVDRLMAARCSNQLTDKELAQANIDTVRRLMATSDPRLREIGQLLIDCGQF